jgi:hypothetical protein
MVVMTAHAELGLNYPGPGKSYLAPGVNPSLDYEVALKLK